MKIGWFCPLLPEKTDIAHYTARILSELSKCAEIVLWTDKETWNPEFEKWAVVKHYEASSINDHDLNYADINIYHIGNNSRFHGSIWKASCRKPGIVVLHDVNLHYLFTTLYPNYARPGADQAAYVDLMHRFHGSVCKQDIGRFLSGELTWTTISERYPLTNAAVSNSLGIVVHTQEAYEQFSQDKISPVLYLPLPFPTNPKYQFSRERLSKPPYRLIIFGHLGGLHRRIQSVLAALSHLPERFFFHLDIYGEIWDKNYIEGLIHKEHLEDLVSLHGFVEEEVLDAALSQADLAINLRYPTGGEASGSQLRIWSHALPTLVTRIGWYGNLSEKTVAFVRPDHEVEDIQHYLQEFVTNPDKFAEMGRKGYQTLADYHSPSIYASRIIEFSKSLLKSPSVPAIQPKPRVSVIISTFNSAKLIPQSIESILQQTYTDFEIIVVDNGSTDNTVEVLRSYHNYNLRYFSFYSNQGASVARNHGLEMARGEFVVFLDVNDCFFQDKLLEQVNYFDTHSFLGLVNSGFRWIDQKGYLLADIQPWHTIPELSLESWLFSRSVLVTSAIMFRREWLEWAGGFDTRFNYEEDINLICRLALLGCPADWLKKTTVSRCQQEHQSIQDLSERANILQEVLLDVFSQVDLPEKVKQLKNETLYNNLVWSAWNLFQNGGYEEQVDLLRKSLKYKNSTVVESVAEWLELYVMFAQNSGQYFDAYSLATSNSWKKLLAAFSSN